MIDESQAQQELIERVVNIKRVAKVVKGGKRMKLSACVVVGDGAGRVGVGHAKAAEVAAAVRKATEHARKDMVKVALKAHTIPHPTIGRFATARVMLKPASRGTGLVACPQVRAVLEAAGARDVLTKSLGSNNPYNLALATLRGLAGLRTIEEIARLRNKPISHLVERRTPPAAETT